MQIAALRHPLATVASRVLPSGAKMGLKRLQRAYVRTFWSFTAADLRNALQRLGVEPGDFLMVHSSFDRFLGFRRGPEVVRSLHPTHSVAVSGNKADAIVAGHHAAETPCGRPTPYGKLLEY